VGGRLVPQLLKAGYRVRVLVRDEARLEGRPWHDQVEVVEGNLRYPASVRPALEGADAAFFLIRSQAGDNGLKQDDLKGARNFGTTAREAGVKRIIYLSQLGDPENKYAELVRAGQKIGEALRESGLPVTEFQASLIVGSGSLAFEMIRYLTERVPVMVCPNWVRTRVQPIAIRNVLDYLEQSLVTPSSEDKILQIGGSELLTYRNMLRRYAKIRGLRRGLITLPVLTPRLSSYWVHFITPVPASMARPLIDGFRYEAVVNNDTSRRIFPDIRLLNYEMSVRLALANLDAGKVETTWNDALATSQGDFKPVVLTSHEGMLLEQRQREVSAPPGDVFRAFTRLGGDRGWTYANWAWRVRGAMDRLIGGVGMRRGRRDPDTLRVGDALDFWRVEAVEPDHLLRLRAEMKVPGDAWLQFEAAPSSDSKTRLTQTAYFASKGLSGLLYWYVLYPIHGVIFSGMIRKLSEEAEATASS
jgi:uncharacterized protein YbjT (DUF2867 family)/uncharacterized protein YndB with AHSA1/START domain